MYQPDRKPANLTQEQRTALYHRQGPDWGTIAAVAVTLATGTILALALWWALGCLQMGQAWRSGADTTVERVVDRLVELANPAGT